MEAKFCSFCGAEFLVVCDSFDAFLSYRRETGSDLASLLKIQLENRYHKKIFLDVNELQVGRFDDELLRRIEGTRNFILILSRASLDRCANKSDWLKREVMHALKFKCNIIPVLTEGFSFPSDEIWALLPPEMRILSSLNGITYSHIHQDSAIRKIASYMKSETEIIQIPGNTGPEKPQPSASTNSSPSSDTHRQQDPPRPDKPATNGKPDDISRTDVTKTRSSFASVNVLPKTNTNTNTNTNSSIIFSTSPQESMTSFPVFRPRLGEIKLELIGVIPATGSSDKKPAIGSASISVVGSDPWTASSDRRPFFGLVSIISQSKF
jgi:hypothetical protein